jgi:predicted nucleic acid-binding protein
MNRQPREVYILDSFAMLAYLDAEDGAERVEAVLRMAQRRRARVCLPAINLGEVLYIVEREQGLPLAQRVLAAIEQLPVDILEATRERVFAAAHVKAHFRLSYADAFAVAAAQELGGIVLTGDPEFAAIQHLVRVEWLVD